MGKGLRGVTVLALVIVVLFCGAASADTLTVGSSGCDYTKIQDAVDDAEVGDMIVVYNGTYTENVCVDKRLKLRGEGADVVTVRAARSGHEVFEVTADRVNISGFTVTGATGSNVAGIRLYDADHCVISENNAHGNCEGIRLHLSSNNTLANNTLDLNNRYGIRFLGNSNNNMIKDNTLNSNGMDGIYMYSSHNTLTGNTLNSNGRDGIYITDSSNNTLANNTLNSNEHCGIHLHSYYYKYNPKNRYNTLTGNTANSNGKYGIYLDASVGNVVVNNTANSNKDGIHISYVSSINNTIHHNSFADNIQYDAYDSCHDQDYYHRTNTWDNGTEGNYYSDYPGTDSDGDGIGDTPYSIPRSDGNVDNYPLMQAWNGYQVHNLNTDETFLGIQAAIDDSDTDDGHTITVGEGVYRMNVNVNKRLTLAGAGGDVVTVVASPLSDYVFDVTENYVNISGFMVTGAGSGKGIYLNGTDHCTISNNIASNNEYGICLDSSSDNKLTGNIMSGNTYNFNVFFDPTLSNFIHDIDTSNLVNGKPVYYWVDQRDRQVPYDAGFVGIVNSTNITVRDLALTNNGNGVLFVCTNNSRIENATTSNSHQGIRLILSSNNMLTNNNVSGNNCGIDIEASNNNTLTDNTASDNNGYGIGLTSSSNNTLQGNTANSNNRDGIELYSSSCNTLTDNSASDNNGYGIGMYYSSNNMLTGNTASRNSHGINLLDSNNNTLTDNTANSNNGIGIYLRSSSANALVDNTVDSNEDYGVYMSSSSSNKLRGNTISANDCGIYLNSSSSNTLANNNASSNVDYGIHLHHSSNNKLIENTANWNNGDIGYHGDSDCDWKDWFAGDGGNGYGYGIILSSSNNNTLAGNTADLNSGRGGNGGGGSPCFYGGDGGDGYGYGIYLRSSSNNTLTGNTANSNCGRGGAGGSGGGRPDGSEIAIGGGGDGGDGYGYGIYLRGSSNNMLTGNTANSNSGDGGRGGRGLDSDTDDGDPGGDYGYGIHLPSSSTANTLYHNNLTNNTPYNAYDDSNINTWDSGSEGNYYSDYNGADNNTDGIGDDPYHIPGGTSTDRYPLMRPWTGATQLLGDLNSDGSITPADAAIALTIAAGGSTSCDPTLLAAADVNDDNRVTSLDALMILQAAAGAITI